MNCKYLSASVLIPLLLSLISIQQGNAHHSHSLRVMLSSRDCVLCYKPFSPIFDANLQSIDKYIVYDNPDALEILELSANIKPSELINRGYKFIHDSTISLNKSPFCMITVENENGEILYNEKLKYTTLSDIKKITQGKYDSYFNVQVKDTFEIPFEKTAPRSSVLFDSRGKQIIIDILKKKIHQIDLDKKKIQSIIYGDLFNKLFPEKLLDASYEAYADIYGISSACFDGDDLVMKLFVSFADTTESYDPIKDERKVDISISRNHYLVRFFNGLNDINFKIINLPIKIEDNGQFYYFSSSHGMIVDKDTVYIRVENNGLKIENYDNHNIIGKFIIQNDSIALLSMTHASVLPKFNFLNSEEFRLWNDALFSSSFFKINEDRFLSLDYFNVFIGLDSSEKMNFKFNQDKKVVILSKEMSIKQDKYSILDVFSNEDGVKMILYDNESKKKLIALVDVQSGLTIASQVLPSIKGNYSFSNNGHIFVSNGGKGGKYLIYNIFI